MMMELQGSDLKTKFEGGFAVQKDTCFEGLRDCIRTDFSDRVLVSYGLFSSPHPFGSKVVCEIDLRDQEEDLLCKKNAVEFSVQVLIEHGSSRIPKNIMMDESFNMEEGSSGVDISFEDCNQTNFSDRDMESQSEKLGLELSKEESLYESADCRDYSEVSNLHRQANNLSCRQERQILDCYEEGKLVSLEHIMKLSPKTAVGAASYEDLKRVLLDMDSGSLEESILTSLKLFIEEKVADPHALEFMKSVAIGNRCPENSSSVCIRHPNILPILGFFKSERNSYLVFPKVQHTLKDILHFSPAAMDNDLQIRFIIYQILSALAYSHSQGITHGSLDISNILLMDTYWCLLDGFGEICPQDLEKKPESSRACSSKIISCDMTCPCYILFSERTFPPNDWETDFRNWSEGKLSNYEYLLTLNRLAGRRWGDRTFHTVMPWVIDFTLNPDDNSDSGWRDLRKSKWHLAKGDEQLDFTYASAEIPHHVSDECLSELAVCSYKARRLPLGVLRRTVRSVYEPNEYPSNMQRLYQWTPDECIPEFYSDPQIFYSIHEGMSNLAVPSWAVSPEEFIKLHRSALESDHVSMNLHHWIDLTFGYKLSGEAAIKAKNVTLSTAAPLVPRSSGRRQLFSSPHPMRRSHSRCSEDEQILAARHIVPHPGTKENKNKYFLKIDSHLKSSQLDNLEENLLFIESSRHLSPCYRPLGVNDDEALSQLRPEERLLKSTSELISESSNDCSDQLFDFLDSSEDKRINGFQDFLLWESKLNTLLSTSKAMADDIFSLGCVIAEIYLQTPLFDKVSLESYNKDGILPGILKKLPPYLCRIIELTLQRDWRRRPSAKALLGCPYFPNTLHSAYRFLAPLNLFASNSSRLQYAAKLAKVAFSMMGSVAAEICVPCCLPLIMSPESLTDVEAAVQLLREFLGILKLVPAKSLLLPGIRKMIQSNESPHLKVSLLQISFVRELWKSFGFAVYLEKIHPLVISNLHNSSHKNSITAASVLLVGSCDELGVPISIYQTILPLVQCLGRGLTFEGLDTLVRIGVNLGETVIIHQMFPILKNIILSGLDFASMDKPEPFQSWQTLAIIDALTVVDGFVRVLPPSVILKEMVQEPNNVHLKILMKTNLSRNLVQHTTTALLAICQHIGPDWTSEHVLPQIKPLLDELVFSQDGDNFQTGNKTEAPSTSGNGISGTGDEINATSRFDVVLYLYPALASFLGMEKLRQSFTTWLLLEQILSRKFNWKWIDGDGVSQNKSNKFSAVAGKSASKAFNPANLLLNGVGWSIPQTQLNRISKSTITPRQPLESKSSSNGEILTSNNRCEPWSWLPNIVESLKGTDFLSRLGSIKDENPWRLKASILNSARAHPGALRAIAVENNENIVFSAGAGQRMRGIVRKWRLSTMDNEISYLGHDEVVNDVCILPGYERVASCDGTIHIWSSQTGKRFSLLSEPSDASSSMDSSFSSISRDGNHGSSLNSTPLSASILSAGFNGNLYSCMLCLTAEEKFVAGTGNGYLRFIDINTEKHLHLWRCQPLESSYSLLISAICSSAHQGTFENSRGLSSSSWITAGFSSGHCALLDSRSGSINAHWRAHDGFVTGLATLDDHMLISSSLDKTLRLWDLRSGHPQQLQLLKGHTDGVSGFSILGHDILSASGSNIGVSSLSKSYDLDLDLGKTIGSARECSRLYLLKGEDSPERHVLQAVSKQQHIYPQKMYSADRGTKNLSAISSIQVLPFSRLFLVGTEDGYLKVCC